MNYQPNIPQPNIHQIEQLTSINTKLNNLLYVCKENINNMDNNSFMDLFANKHAIGFNMLNYFSVCSANCLEYSNYIINYALLKCNYNKRIKKVIEKCNTLDMVEGHVYNNLSPQFFTYNNAKKIDAIRQYISNDTIDEHDFYFLLASLLITEKISDGLVPIHTNQIPNISKNVNMVTRLSTDIPYYDVIYIDLPQSKDTSSLIPNYIAHYNGIKEKTIKIPFCKKTEIKKAFSVLINSLRCHYIILSYTTGLLSMEEVKKIVLLKGFVKLYKIKEECIWIIDTTKEGIFVFEIDIN